MFDSYVHLQSLQQSDNESVLVLRCQPCEWNVVYTRKPSLRDYFTYGIALLLYTGTVMCELVSKKSV